jgi:hypothetical protein
MINTEEVFAIESELSLRVRNFKRLGNNNWNFSCDICGDSKKNQRKARFFLGENKGKLMCYCHNCGFAGTFKSYVEQQHPDIYKKLQNQKFLEGNTLFAIDDIIQSIDSDEILLKMFFINRFRIVDDWISFLRQKKISLDKKNFSRLLLLHRSFHQPLIQKEK